MGKELVPVEPAVEGEVFELQAAVVTDNVTDVLPGEHDDVSTSLDEAAEAALADGIALVFDALLAESGTADFEDVDLNEGGDNDNDASVGDPTLALLAELNRLWAAPLAA